MGSPSAYEAGLCVDEQFHKTVLAIEKRLQLLGRLPQVRIKAWLCKLKETTSNLVWKRNRNLYARLLLEQLRAGCLEVPFNALPPNGGLPTLPAYLTYRFMSPPRQRSSSCGPDSLSPGSPVRPRSAGAGGLHSNGFMHMPCPEAHTAWTVMHTPAPNMQLPLQDNAPTAAGVLQPGQLSALSPIRCSPPRQGALPGQLQHNKWLDSASPTGAGSSRRASGKGCKGLAGPTPTQQLDAMIGVGQREFGSSGGGAGGGQFGPVTPAEGGGLLRQRPSSPGAAGLLNAAVVLAAEVEAGRGDAANLDCRLRYAEDKLLQQEAELVRLQGQASAARRRVKAVTAATLGDMVERYGSAAAAWDSPTGQRAGKSPSSLANCHSGPSPSTPGPGSPGAADSGARWRVLMQQLEEAQLTTNMILEQLQCAGR